MPLLTPTYACLMTKNRVLRKNLITSYIKSMRSAIPRSKLGFKTVHAAIDANKHLRL